MKRISLSLWILLREREISVKVLWVLWNLVNHSLSRKRSSIVAFNKALQKTFPVDVGCTKLVQLNHVIDSCVVCYLVVSWFSILSSSWVHCVHLPGFILHLCILYSSLSKVLGSVLFVLHVIEQIKSLQLVSEPGIFDQDQEWRHRR